MRFEHRLKNYTLVWDESGRVTDQWFEHLEGQCKGNIEVDVVDSFRKVTLNVIASAGFGQHFPWNTPAADENSSGLHFSTSIIDSVERIFWRALTPRWAYSLPIPQITKTMFAFNQMERHIENLIHEARQATVTEESQNPIAFGSLLKGLLEANDELECNSRLSDRELLSNIFILLFAGHETSAHTLSFVMAIFALYPDIHAAVREEADKVWPDPAAHKSSTYRSDFVRLPYTLALFYETLRHFPAEPVLPRIASQDTVLLATKRKEGLMPSEYIDQEFTVVVPRGTVVLPDLYAMHMNTQYWGPTAPEFDPTRFLSTNWPKHAFAPFAGGPRACIGRGFATAESVRIIARVAQTWDIRCKDSMIRMPWAERKRILLRWRQQVTMVPVDIKLSFSPRK
ncbi:cytochrome P450 family protein [Ceratobasidium sp. AG-Ba]|nr:cytochrome P450 family protein [Ceratobasidium sp. AG-Ba]QRW04200.1 cytochrome P450 family protein [Ceratobasidium sp. AG-Ba]